MLDQKCALVKKILSQAPAESRAASGTIPKSFYLDDADRGLDELTRLRDGTWSRSANAPVEGNLMKRSIVVAFLMALGALSLGSTALAEGSCATLYEHINFGGDRREVDSGASVSWIGGPWNDQVSSIEVRPGCVLNAYEHINFGGAHGTFQGSVPWVGDGWNDRISSYTCTCP